MLAICTGCLCSKTLFDFEHFLCISTGSMWFNSLQIPNAKHSHQPRYAAHRLLHERGHLNIFNPGMWLGRIQEASVSFGKTTLSLFTRRLCFLSFLLDLHFFNSGWLRYRKPPRRRTKIPNRPPIIRTKKSKRIIHRRGCSHSQKWFGSSSQKIGKKRGDWGVKWEWRRNQERN